MSTASIILSILSTAVGALSCLTMLTFLMAGGANSSPAQIQQIKILLLVTAAIGLASLIGAVLRLIWGHGWTAAVVGGLPTLWMIGFLIWAFTTSW